MFEQYKHKIHLDIFKAESTRFQTQDFHFAAQVSNKLQFGETSRSVRRSKTRAAKIRIKPTDVSWALQRFVKPNVPHITSNPRSTVYDVSLPTLQSAMRSFTRANLTEQCNSSNSDSFVAPKGVVRCLDNGQLPNFTRSWHPLLNQQTSHHQPPVGTPVAILDCSPDGNWLLILSKGMHEKQVMGVRIRCEIGWIKKTSIDTVEGLNIKLSTKSAKLDITLPRFFVRNGGFISGSILDSDNSMSSTVQDLPPPPPPIIGNCLRNVWAPPLPQPRIQPTMPGRNLHQIHEQLTNIRKNMSFFDRV